MNWEGMEANNHSEMDLLEDLVRARFTEMECWTFRMFNSMVIFSYVDISRQQVKAPT